MKIIPRINCDNLINILFLIYLCCIYAFPFQVLKIELIFLIFILFQIKKIKITFYLVWSFLFSMLVIFSVVYSKEPFFSFIGAIQIIKILILNNILVLIKKDKRQVSFFLKSFIIAGIVLILRLLILVPIEDLGKTRLQVLGLFNANDIALNLSISLIFLLYFIFIKKEYNFYYLINLPVLYLFIFLTGSKKGFIFSIVSLIFTILLNLKNKKKIIYYIPLLIFGLICSFKIIMDIPLLYNSLGYRLEIFLLSLKGNNRVDGSTVERLKMISTGMNLFSDRLFLGYGLAGFEFYSGFGMYSHNNYIEILVNFGILGFFLYYILYIFLFINNIKLYLLKMKLIIPFFINVIIMLFMEMGVVAYKDRVFHLIFALNFIVIELLKNETKERQRGIK